MRKSRSLHCRPQTTRPSGRDDKEKKAGWAKTQRLLGGGPTERSENRRWLGLRGLAGRRGVPGRRGARGLPCWLFRTRENHRGCGRDRRMLVAGECRGDSKFQRGSRRSGKCFQDVQAGKTDGGLIV